MSIYTKEFWRDLGERAVSTFGQVSAGFIAAALTAVAAGQGVLEFDWTTAAFVIAGSTLFAILKGLGAAKMNPESGASFGTAVPKGLVAAVEAERTGEYAAEEASPYPEGTPVDVVPERLGEESPYVGEEPLYPAEIDAPLEDDSRLQQ